MHPEMMRWNLSETLTKGLLLAVIITIAFFSIARQLQAATAVVPADFVTIQKAVDHVQSDADPGVVIINSNTTFDESIYVTESVTIMAGNGFSPTIEKTTGYYNPVIIYANKDSDTSITLKGLSINASSSPVSRGISISNKSVSNRLNVSLNEVRITGYQIQSAISVASTNTAADISLTISDSFIQMIGEPAGSPQCLRLDPYDYNLTVTLDNNTWRFSAADGIRIEPGKEGRKVSVTANANIFEGFEIDATTPRQAVYISGSGTSEVYPSGTCTTLNNNFFISASSAVSVTSSETHTPSVYLSRLWPNYRGSSCVAYHI